MRNEEIIMNFLKNMNPIKKYGTFDKSVVKKYNGKFRGDIDSIDFIVALWEKIGLCSFKNGLFWLVNPEDFKIASNFPNVHESAIVFARSCMGGLFLFEELTIGKSISYYNVHKGDKEIIATNFDVFLEWDIPDEVFWKQNCYGKIELKAIKKFDAIEKDDCITFVPALALGGEEKISNLQKVKINENLEILAQLLRAC